MEGRVFRLVEHSDEPFMNMAVDEAMLEARAEGRAGDTLRIYYWKKPAVTIGYFQSAQKEVDIEEALRLGVPVIRRITGGGAVLHDRELTYSIVCSEGLFGREIVKSYRRIASFIIEALRILGVDASFEGINDIVVNNLKVSGNAQTRRKGIILQHGTLLISPSSLFSLLKISGEKQKGRQGARVGFLDAMIKGDNSFDYSFDYLFDRLADALKRSFSSHIAPLVKGELSREEIVRAGNLADEKYRTEEWNMRR